MMPHFDPGAATDAANSRLNGRKRVADALVQRNLAAAGYPINERPDSQQRREIGLALARIKDRSRTPVQPVQMAFNETTVGPGVAPRALDYGLGRTATMPLHSPAGPIRTGAPGRYGDLPARKIAGDAQPMGQLFGTGTSADPVPQRGHGPLGGTEPASSRDNQRESHTGYILPIQRNGETGVWSPAVPRLAQDIWDEAVSAATLPDDVQSGRYHLPSLGEPGISEDDGYNVYRDGKLLGNRLANERSFVNRTIGAAGTLAGGGTGFAATHGAKAAMDPSILRMGGGSASKGPPRVSVPVTKKGGELGQAKRPLQRIPPYKRVASSFDDFASEIARVLETGQSSKRKLFHKDLGEITIDLGTPGDPRKNFKGGWGLDHIQQKRATQFDAGDISTSPDRFMVEILPGILSEGKLKWIDQSRRNAYLTLRHNDTDYMAVLSLDRHGNHETWVLTGMERYSSNTPDKWGRW